MRDGKRWIFWGAVGAITLALLGWAFWPRAERVDIVTIIRGPLVVTLDEEGETRVRERFVVSAPVAGRLLRIELEPGDPVVAHETVLATFQPSDPTPLDPRSRAESESQVRAFEAELERAKHERDRTSADLEFTKRDSSRARRLAALDVLSKEKLEITELGEKRALENFDAAEHAVESATHQLSGARAHLLNLGNPERPVDDPANIYSPINGVVLRRMRESESVVAAGEPLLEVGDAHDLEIVADYLSRDAVRIRPGAPVHIERWGGSGVLQARVRRVEPSAFTKISALGVEEKRVNIVIELVTPYADRESLADGFRVETRVVITELSNVIQAPTGSMFRRGSDWAVFAVEDGRARLRSVEIGARTPAFVEILDGITEHDLVIAHPGDTISEGTRVAPRTIPY
ncbi:MAG: HlyD family secretion protein [Myxococcota bacterium]|jgi:HlyD family secretion protein